VPPSPSESNSFSHQDNSKIAFKPEELGFFDPELSEVGGYHADKAGKHCRNCNSTFESGNKLHQHLRNCKASDNTRRAIKIKTRSTIIVPGKDIPILKSSREFKDCFRTFHYATVKISLNQENELIEVYLDIDCGISIINKT
jgi:hypothetical protein